MVEPVHTFDAIASLENLSLRELANAFPGSRLSAHEMRLALPEGGELFLYPFRSKKRRGRPEGARVVRVGLVTLGAPLLDPDPIDRDASALLVREGHVVAARPQVREVLVRLSDSRAAKGSTRFSPGKKRA